MSDRLQRFRDQMDRLVAADDPANAINAGLYTPPPGRSAGQELAARLSLRRGGTLLLAGGVGSGKSTELLVAARELQQLNDVRAIVIDVSRHHDLRSLAPGVLVTMAGVVLTQGRKSEIAERFQQWAYGREVIVETPPINPSAQLEAFLSIFQWQTSKVHHPGLLRPPGPVSPEVQQKVDALLAATGNEQRLVLLFDSLDRMDSTADVDRLLREDVAALNQAGIGLVLTIPTRLLYEDPAELLRRADRLVYQPFIDVEQDREGVRFLLDVLARRSTDLLQEPARLALVQASGGVLRDLLSLAQSAVEEAFLAGDAEVLPRHVGIAAETFGRSLLLGVDEDDVKLLARLSDSGEFAAVGERAVKLLTSRAVLMYRRPDGSTRYACHPTIQPLVTRFSLAS